MRRGPWCRHRVGWRLSGLWQGTRCSRLIPQSHGVSLQGHRGQNDNVGLPDSVIVPIILLFQSFHSCGGPGTAEAQGNPKDPYMR